MDNIKKIVATALVAGSVGAVGGMVAIQPDLQQQVEAKETITVEQPFEGQDADTVKVTIKNPSVEIQSYTLEDLQASIDDLDTRISAMQTQKSKLEAIKAKISPEVDKVVPKEE